MEDLVKLRNKIYLSVVFSFRNEQEVLPELIKRTRCVLNSEKEKGEIKGFELIFVNDHSNDHSLEILHRFAQDHDDIRILNMSRVFGVSPCVLAGFENSCGDAVVYMDADLQDPPEVIPQLLEQYRENSSVEVVHTIRTAREGESRIKMFVTRIGYALLNKITSVNLPVEAGDFKLLSRRVVDELVKMKEKRPFLRGLVCWVGYEQAFVSYRRESRFAGTTKFSVFSWRVMSNFFNSALISFSSAPLRLSVFLGFFAVLMDLILVLHVCIERFNGRAIPGWTAIMIAVLFVGSIQLFCIGIIGLYLNSIFEEVKGRPNYIIESTFGFPQKEK